MKYFALLFVCLLSLVFATAVYAASDEDEDDGSFAGDGSETEAVTTGSAAPFIPPLDIEEEDEEEADDEEGVPIAPSLKKATIWKKPPEKYSDDTTKVIKSYGLASGTNVLINKHKEAAAGQGNRQKAERYSKILKKYPMDYLAAYRAAEVIFAMGRNGQALKWVNKSLEIYPDYMPARRLKKQIQGALK